MSEPLALVQHRWVIERARAGWAEIGEMHEYEVCIVDLAEALAATHAECQRLRAENEALQPEAYLGRLVRHMAHGSCLYRGFGNQWSYWVIIEGEECRQPENALRAALGEVRDD